MFALIPSGGLFIPVYKAPNKQTTNNGVALHLGELRTRRVFPTKRRNVHGLAADVWDTFLDVTRL